MPLLAAFVVASTLAVFVGTCMLGRPRPPGAALSSAAERTSPPR